MYFLNYIYFLIITALGLKFIFQKQGVVTHPLNKEQKLLFTGPELFWTLTFATGLIATGPMLAIRLFALELFCIIVLFVVKNKPIWTMPILLYFVYILWLLLGLSYSHAPDYGFRVILKYIYPLLIMLIPSAIVRNWEVFLKAAKWARIVAVISIIFSFVPFIGILVSGVFWYGTAKAINYISMCVLSLALYFHAGKNKKDLLLAILFMIPCILWVFRTSIMGTTLAIMVFFFFRYKLRALPLMFLSLVLFAASIFFIPSVKEKMFNKEGFTVEDLQSGNISKDDIDSNGRFAMWDWSIERYYNGKELLGSGTGNLQEVFYSLEHPFGTIRIVHNDYVQILCDNGLIGIILFGLSFLSLIIHSFFVYNNKRYSVAVRICAIVAGSSAAGMLLTMYTDNVINYTMATLSYPCGFYGMMLGLMVTDKKNRNAV